MKAGDPMKRASNLQKWRGDAEQCLADAQTFLANVPAPVGVWLDRWSPQLLKKVARMETEIRRLKGRRVSGAKFR